MGIRSKLKGKLKAALGGASKESGDQSPRSKETEEQLPPSKHFTSISEDTGAGNLRDTSDLPWYLKYDDNDGWESTDVETDVEDD